MPPASVSHTPKRPPENPERYGVPDPPRTPPRNIAQQAAGALPFFL